MESIFIIKDNRRYDEMRDLRPAVINRIERNVCILQQKRVNVRICSTADIPSENESFIKRNGYQIEPGLYDKLILEHNNANPNAILYGWPRPDEDC